VRAASRRERRVEDAQPLRVRLRRVELPAQSGARLFRLDELTQVVERQVEQVAQPRQLREPLDVLLPVQPVRALRACAAAEQADLLVVADRARRDADPLGNLADADHAATSSTSTCGT
jgi:hypothetical protein